MSMLLLRQLGDDLARRLLILHEDQVPHLDEAIAVLVGRTGWAAGDVVAMVVENLRAGAARAVVAHRPEIVLGRDADDAALGQAGDLLPQVEGLVVGMIDGRGQAVGAQPPFFRQQVPRQLDRAILEIVAEREIAEHFEEGVVARGVADIVEVVVLAAGADAFLRAGRGLYGRVSSPVKTFLNGTMPALTNISVGSLCGTSGADGTRAWPAFSKNSRKPRRMSLVEVIVQPM